MVKSKCQSCGMPMDQESQCGTESNGAFTTKFCCFCFQKGRFTEPNLTVDQMVTKVAAKMKEMRIPGFIATWMAKGVRKLDRWQPQAQSDQRPADDSKP